MHVCSTFSTIKANLLDEMIQSASVYVLFYMSSFLLQLIFVFPLFKIH